MTAPFQSFGKSSELMRTDDRLDSVRMWGTGRECLHRGEAPSLLCMLPDGRSVGDLDCGALGILALAPFR